MTATTLQTSSSIAIPTDSVSGSASFRAMTATERDSALASHEFAMRSIANDQFGAIEEDSTDIFTLTRCSPLNDF